jgi:hypothetical protein
MMGMVIGYWHKEGLDIYRHVDKKPVKQVSGSLDELKPIRGVFDKRVLIVGRELLIHTRKRYPPALEEKLMKAVGVEIGDIFPITKPVYHCRVYESSSAYTTLDIWAWGSEDYARLKEVFPFNYVIPEDLAFSSDVPEVKVFQYRGMTSMLAHSGNRFLGGASYPDSGPISGINERDVERFFSGLGRYGSDIKQMKVYGSVPFKLKDIGLPEIARVTQGDYPPCMDYLSSLNLNEFKVKGEYRLSSKIDLICRILIYLILGYGLMLYLTERNYDRAASEIKQKIKAMDSKLTLRDAGQKVDDYSEIIREINGKLIIRYSPLKVMDVIARNLPSGSFIGRMVLNENNLEVTASSKDPISVVKALGGAEGVKVARLKGAPVRDSVTGMYNFVIMMELSK